MRACILQDCSKYSSMIRFSLRNISDRIIGIIIFLSFCQLLSGQSKINTSQYSFRASVVKVNITPTEPQNLLGYSPRKSTAILDSLYHRIVILDDGRIQFILVSSDICINNCIEYDRIAAKLNNQFGINPLNFWWTTTHTHSAPEIGPAGLDQLFLGERYNHERDKKYEALVEKLLVDGILEAQQKLEPATLGVGWGFAQANINRRAKDVDGIAFLGMNPDGPTDKKMGIIRIDKLNGQPLAVIVNYPIHGTVLGNTTYISADAPGVVSGYVEMKLGAPCLFINGAAGNLAPIYSVRQKIDEPFLGHFRTLIGDKVLEANSKIKTVGEVTLFTREIIVETPRKEGLKWPTDFSRYTRTTTSGDHLVRLPVRLLRINEDIAIWSMPCELFCEISNEVRDRSPFPFTFYYGYSNGWLGYVPTAEEWKHHGYEPRVSPFTPSAAYDITESVVVLLHEKL